MLSTALTYQVLESALNQSTFVCILHLLYISFYICTAQSFRDFNMLKNLQNSRSEMWSIDCCSSTKLYRLLGMHCSEISRVPAAEKAMNHLHYPQHCYYKETPTVWNCQKTTVPQHYQRLVDFWHPPRHCLGVQMLQTLQFSDLINGPLLPAKRDVGLP